MNMSKTYGLTAALLAVCLFGGCGRDTSEPVPEQPVSRMRDPEYVQQLEGHKDEQKRLMTAMAESLREYEAAKAEDPDGTSERFRAADQRRREVVEAVVASRRNAQKTVFKRIHQELNQTNSIPNKGNK